MPAYVMLPTMTMPHHFEYVDVWDLMRDTNKVVSDSRESLAESWAAIGLLNAAIERFKAVVTADDHHLQATPDSAETSAQPTECNPVTTPSSPVPVMARRLNQSGSQTQSFGGRRPVP
jgi:hypothetical protein